MQCPLFLLAKVSWRQDRLLEGGEGKVTESGLVEFAEQEINTVLC
jgi:hypothetical protein